MRRHRVLVAFWIATIVAFACGFLVSEPALSVLAQFSAFILAIISAKCAEGVGVLERRLVYRGALGLLLVTSMTVVICGGGSVAFGKGSDHGLVGFICLASLNVVTGVLAWRALVRPAPRRAALVGLLAVVAELFALLIDLGINLNHHAFHPTSFQIVAMLAGWGATWAGALVCIAALLSFSPQPMYEVPDARVVD